jgi:hypothetical protein
MMKLNDSGITSAVVGMTVSTSGDICNAGGGDAERTPERKLATRTPPTPRKGSRRRLRPFQAVVPPTPSPHDNITLKWRNGRFSQNAQQEVWTQRQEAEEEEDRLMGSELVVAATSLPPPLPYQSVTANQQYVFGGTPSNFMDSRIYHLHKPIVHKIERVIEIYKYADNVLGLRNVSSSEVERIVMQLKSLLYVFTGVFQECDYKFWFDRSITFVKVASAGRLFDEDKLPLPNWESLPRNSHGKVALTIKGVMVKDGRLSFIIHVWQMQRVPAPLPSVVGTLVDSEVDTNNICIL